jgi:hypothetical protein
MDSCGWGEGDWSGGIRSMYFIYLYENRTIKPVEIVLTRREGDEGEGWTG